MKIQYNNTSNGTHRAIDVDMSCREIITVAIIVTAIVAIAIGLCLFLGIDPVIIIKLLADKALLAVFG